MVMDDLSGWRERLRPGWLAFLIGGNYRVHCDGGFAYCWRPSLPRLVRRYYQERWWNAGYTLAGWLAGRKDGSHGHGMGGLAYRVTRRK
jgi:hypothetical protein